MLSGPKNSNHVRKVKKSDRFFSGTVGGYRGGGEDNCVVLCSNRVDVVTGSWKSTIA